MVFVSGTATVAIILILKQRSYCALWGMARHVTHITLTCGRKEARGPGKSEIGGPARRGATRRSLRRKRLPLNPIGIGRFRTGKRRRNFSAIAVVIPITACFFSKASPQRCEPQQKRLLRSS